MRKNFFTIIVLLLVFINFSFVQAKNTYKLTNKDLKVLFPGAGHAYDAEYLFGKGFKNTFVADFAETAFANFTARVPNFPKGQFIVGDFFSIDQTFDLIIEQTFFCALSPNLRQAYAKHMHSILKPGGKLAGVLFTFPLTESGPPFGGSVEEYKNYFEPYFTINVMEDCYNSITPRLGKEVFIILEKQNI